MWWNLAQSRMKRRKLRPKELHNWRFGEDWILSKNHLSWEQESFGTSLKLSCTIKKYFNSGILIYNKISWENEWNYEKWVEIRENYFFRTAENGVSEFLNSKDTTRLRNSISFFEFSNLLLFKTHFFADY